MPAMKGYSPGRGRKKAVAKFTLRQGMWMVGVVTIAMIGVLLLWLLGYLRFDLD